jgi:hypothetical protein
MRRANYCTYYDTTLKKVMQLTNVSKHFGLATCAAVLVGVIYFHMKAYSGIAEASSVIFSVVLVPYCSVVALAGIIASRLAVVASSRYSPIGFFATLGIMVCAASIAIILAGQFFALAFLGPQSLGIIFIGGFASISFVYGAWPALTVALTIAVIAVWHFGQQDTPGTSGFELT